MSGLIVVPNTGHFSDLFVHAWTNLLVGTIANNIQAEVRFIGHSLIYNAREDGVKYMQEKNHDWIFFLDSDMTPDPDIINKFLSYDKPIVSAACYKRSVPFEPCFFKSISYDYDKKDGTCETYLDYPKGLIEVGAVGMACCLIKREVFEKIPQPWYMPLSNMGEDLSFCVRAKEANIPIYVDTNTCCGHISQQVVIEDYFLQSKKVLDC